MSCGPAGDDPEQNKEYFVSLLDSGKRLAYGNVADPRGYKPVFFKPESSEDTTPLRVKKSLFVSSWWLIPIKVDSKVQSLVQIGKDTQLSMGDAEKEEYEAVNLLFDPLSKKICSMTHDNQGLTMGANGEAMMLENVDCKYSLDDAN